MARGRSGGGRQSLDKYKGQRDYYEGLPSDKDYLKKSRQRGARSRRNAWLIRLFVLALIAGAVYQWGDVVMRKVRVQSRSDTGEFKQVGGRIKSGRDARSGADWTEDGQSP
jgi:hypothetical protein